MRADADRPPRGLGGAGDQGTDGHSAATHHTGAGGWEQLSLDELARALAQPTARATDRSTTHEAARSMTPVVVATQVAEVVQAIARRGATGATTAELVERIGGDRGGRARRITDAHRAGLLRGNRNPRRAQRASADGLDVDVRGPTARC